MIHSYPNAGDRAKEAPTLSQRKLACLKRILPTINGIARTLTRDPNLYDDLAQEGAISFWLSLVNDSGQTVSWHLCRCRSHMRDYLRCGRSLDSVKRRFLRIQAEGPADDNEEEALYLEEDTVRRDVMFLDTFNEISRRLHPCEREMLTLIAQELRASEIARTLNLSRTAICKRMKKIAEKVRTIGIDF